MLLSVIIPCYNEERTIREVVLKVRATSLPPEWSQEIIIVDDGSANETTVVLEDLEREFKDNLQVIYLAQNLGKGGAIKAGLEVASGEYCLIQDADLELDPQEFPSLLQPIINGHASAVFGYRVISESLHSDKTVLFYGSHFVSWFYNLLFETKFKDITCCYKIFPRRCIDSLKASPSNDFVFDAIEMTYAISKTEKVNEVSVSYRPRKHVEGKKIRWMDGVYCLSSTILLKLSIGKYKPSNIKREKDENYSKS